MSTGFRPAPRPASTRPASLAQSLLQTSQSCKSPRPARPALCAQRRSSLRPAKIWAPPSANYHSSTSPFPRLPPASHTNHLHLLLARHTPASFHPAKALVPVYSCRSRAIGVISRPARVTPLATSPPVRDK